MAAPVVMPQSLSTALDFHFERLMRSAGMPENSIKGVFSLFDQLNRAPSYTDISAVPGDGVASSLTGRATIASGASAAVITNTLVTATSIVHVQLEGTGKGVGGLVCVPGNGSFTVTSVNGTGVVTNTSADTKFSFTVVKI
jgi:hypothetical protein